MSENLPPSENPGPLPPPSESIEPPANRGPSGCGFIVVTFLSVIAGWLICALLSSGLAAVFGPWKSTAPIVASAVVVGLAGAFAYFKLSFRAVGLGLILSSGFALLIVSICG